MEELRIKAERYAQAAGRTLRTAPLGFGQDGYLWATNNTTAVKVFERQSNYDRELGSYQRLLEHQISTLSGFHIPQLVGFDDQLLIVEMSIVSPPYLLDFGKAYIDAPPEHSPETMRDWEEELRELFGERTGKLKAVLASLAALGIYYLDAKPGNIKF